MTDPDWAALDAAWEPARRAGVLGTATTEALIAHAAGFLPAACRVGDRFSGIDLGTRAGVPGIVLAALRPASSWVLVDASERRCEYAATAVRALGLGSRVRVVHARAETVAHDPEFRARQDLVVARSFGPPTELAECALPLVAPDGVLVVSVTEGTRGEWSRAADVVGIRFVDEHAIEAGFLGVRPPTEVPAAWPRRPAARRRSPLF